MAIHSKGIFTWAVKPDNTGGAFFEPFAVKATNDVFDRIVGIMNDTASNVGFYGGFDVPREYVGSASLVITYTSTATSGDIHFGFSYYSASDGETVDPSASQAEASALVIAPSGALQLQVATIGLTAADFAAQDDVGYYLYRKGTSACDDVAAAVIIRNARFDFSDS